MTTGLDEKTAPPHTWSERWLALQTLLGLPITDWAIRRYGFKRTVQFLARHSQPADDFSPPTSAAVQRWAAVMLYANRQIKLHPAACLVESLTVWFLLRRRGAPARLHLGVRTLTEFESHAWVTCYGDVLNDFDDVVEIYTPLNLDILAAEEARP